MNKKCLIILKGYELIQEIANGKIKEGTKFRDLTDSNYEDNSNIYRYENKNFIGRYGGTNILKLLNHDFEILEDEEEIDKGNMMMFEHEWFVQHMPGMNDIECDLAVKINAIIDYLLKLDKKINKED